MILNIGCGKNIMPDCLNVDILGPVIVDLSKFPWPWQDNSIDGIYASHIMEHFQDQEKFISECHRILKFGGFLKLNLPHVSSVASIGCMGHYRTYSYSSIYDYVSRKNFYLCPCPRFKTIYQKLGWWYEGIDTQGQISQWQVPIIWLLDYIFTRLAQLSPAICENTWIYLVGGFREVVWTGRKI